MFNFNVFKKAASFHASNAVDKAAVKGYGAGFDVCDAVARAAIRGKAACAQGRKAHQEALDKRAQEWADFQSFLNGGAKKDKPKKAAPKQQPAEPKAEPEPQPQQPEEPASNGWTDITDEKGGEDDDEEIDLSNAKF